MNFSAAVPSGTFVVVDLVEGLKVGLGLPDQQNVMEAVLRLLQQGILEVVGSNRGYSDIVAREAAQA